MIVRIFLSFALLMMTFVAVQAQTQDEMIDKRVEAELQSFNELVSGDIPALQLTSDQNKIIADIYRAKHEEVLSIDPYKIGKLQASQKFKALAEKATSDAVAVLTLEQKLSYNKNMQAK